MKPYIDPELKTILERFVYGETITNEESYELKEWDLITDGGTLTELGERVLQNESSTRDNPIL